MDICAMNINILEQYTSTSFHLSLKFVRIWIMKHQNRTKKNFNCVLAVRVAWFSPIHGQIFPLIIKEIMMNESENGKANSLFRKLKFLRRIFSPSTVKRTKNKVAFYQGGFEANSPKSQAIYIFAEIF